MSEVDFRVEVLEVLKYLQDIYHKALTEADSRSYTEYLVEINPVQLRMAAVRCVESSAFFPRIAELRKLAGEAVIQPLAAFANRRFVLEQRFYRDGVLDGMAFDALHREMWRAGYWDAANHLRKVQGRLKSLATARKEMAVV